MQKIYLDYNIFVYYFENSYKGLREKIDQLREFYIFPYSPAHIEDLAALIMGYEPETKEFHNTSKTVYEKINSISELTNDFELLPNQNGSIIEMTEHPFECFKRVVEDYHVNRIIDPIEKERLSILKDSDKNGERSKRVSSPQEFSLLGSKYENDLRFRLYFHKELSLRLALEARKHGIKEYMWPEISKSHRLLEDIIEITMNYIEEVRYRPEGIKKSRSRMNDVSHSIYGTAADYFISNDYKTGFISKLKATYQYFGITTKVMTLDQFMKAEDFIVT